MKLFRAAMAAVLAASLMALTAVAATPAIVSPTVSPAPGITTGGFLWRPDGSTTEVSPDDLTVTTPSEEAPGTNQELLEQVSEELGTPTPNVELVEWFDITTENDAIREAIENGETLYVPIEVQGITKDDEDKIVIFQETDEGWVLVPFTIDEYGVITLELTHFGPIAIFRDIGAAPVVEEDAPVSPAATETEYTPTAVTETGSAPATTPKTFDVTVTIAAVAAAMGAACVLIKKRK